MCAAAIITVIMINTDFKLNSVNIKKIKAVRTIKRTNMISLKYFEIRIWWKCIGVVRTNQDGSGKVYFSLKLVE
jgi:hypothetical protein